MRVTALCLLASIACREPSDADDASDCSTYDSRVCVPASELAKLEAGEHGCGGLCGGDVVIVACRPDDASASSSDAAEESSGADDPQCGDFAALICTVESESCREGA
jgi:hypothetical protein